MPYLGAKIADETVLVQKKSIGERNHLYERRERRTGRCVKKKLCVCARGPFVDSVLPHLNRMTFRDEMSPDEDFGIERIEDHNLPLKRTVCLGGKIPPQHYTKFILAIFAQNTSTSHYLQLQHRSPHPV
jgi:hypothetical protein